MAETGESVVIGAYTYASKPDHRDGTSTKSQWTISVIDEHACFALGVDSDWKLGPHSWGLHLIDGTAAYLGRAAVNPGPNMDLCIAFFQLADTCHGYPSDPKRSIREIPPDAVRSDWLSKGYLRPAVIRKLGRGLTCKL